MGVKCILLYRLPKGVAPAREDIDRIVTTLTQRLYCVPEAAARSQQGKDAAAAAAAAGAAGAGAAATSGGERQLEASATLLRQIRAADPTLIASPRSLSDVWLFKLHRDAPSRVFLLAKGQDNITRVNEAEPSVRSFLERRLDYRQRAAIVIQSQSWVMGGDRSSDVTVKLLQVLQQSQSPRVLALEVVYHPATDLAAAEPLLLELAEQIIASVGPATGSAPGQAGMLQLLRPAYANEHKRGAFGALHTVEAYNELLHLGLIAR